MSSNFSILIEGLHKTFRGIPILKGVNLEIRSHELTVIIGKSGCGKSTLLRCLNGFETFEEGVVSFKKISLSGLKTKKQSATQFDTQARLLRNNFGLVFQSFNLFPHLTVMENLIKAPMVVKKTTRSEAERIANDLLVKVGLPTYGDHFPSQLSGGQQQRVAIARALAMAPEVMLYDEPTSALDPLLVDEVFQVMRKIDTDGIPQVVVTHDLRFVKEMADQVVLMDGGQIVEVGSPEQLFSNPKDVRTKEYLSRFKS